MQTLVEEHKDRVYCRFITLHEAAKGADLIVTDVFASNGAKKTSKTTPESLIASNKFRA